MGIQDLSPKLQQELRALSGRSYADLDAEERKRLRELREKSRPDKRDRMRDRKIKAQVEELREDGEDTGELALDEDAELREMRLADKVKEFRQYGELNGRIALNPKASTKGIKRIKQQMSLAENTGGFSSIASYIKAGHGLAVIHAERKGWTRFLKANKIPVARDHRARLLAKHDEALVRAQPDTLKAAIELAQDIEDGEEELETEAPVRPVKQGRPRKSDEEKWKTRFERCLKDAPAGVTVERMGDVVTVTL